MWLPLLPFLYTDRYLSCFLHLSILCLHHKTTVASYRVSPEPEASVLTSRPWGLRRRELHTVRQPSVIEQDEGVCVTKTTSLRPQSHSSSRSRPHTSPEGETRENQRALMWCSGLFRAKGMNRFLFPLIWLQWVDWKSSSTRKGWKSLETQEICYSGWRATKPLITDRNRTRRSTDWSSNPDS